jgi:hypothetical protein
MSFSVPADDYDHFMRRSRVSSLRCSRTSPTVPPRSTGRTSGRAGGRRVFFANHKHELRASRACSCRRRCSARSRSSARAQSQQHACAMAEGRKRANPCSFEIGRRVSGPGSLAGYGRAQSRVTKRRIRMSASMAIPSSLRCWTPMPMPKNVEVMKRVAPWEVAFLTLDPCNTQPVARICAERGNCYARCARRHEPRATRSESCRAPKSRR